KVRGLWMQIMETFSYLEKEKELVDTVLGLPVSQCVLDGTEVVLRVPQLLASRAERGIHQFFTGNVYEGGKLNFLTVIQTLNEALRTLRDEQCQFELNQHLPGIVNNVILHKNILWDLKAESLKIQQEHCVSMRESISKKQEDWEVKWNNFLGMCPFKLTLHWNPVRSVHFI
ncbi:HAUS6 protein, partial [Centropus unirufus]|nr:HAUS6 protein [Centropus unirufus]